MEMTQENKHVDKIETPQITSKTRVSDIKACDLKNKETNDIGAKTLSVTTNSQSKTHHEMINNSISMPGTESKKRRTQADVDENQNNNHISENRTNMLRKRPMENIASGNKKKRSSTR